MEARKHVGKRVLSILLTLMMLLSLVPVMGTTAFAATAGSGTKANPYVVTDYEGLQNILTGNAGTTTYLKLGANIDTKSLNNGDGITKHIEITKNFVLDLNGYTADLYTKTNIGRFIRISAGGLTVLNTGAAKSGKIQGTFDAEGSNYSLITVKSDVGGSFTLESGILNLITKYDSDWHRTILNQRGNVTINGGIVGIDCTRGHALTVSGIGAKTVVNGGDIRRVYIQLTKKTEAAEGDLPYAIINGGTFSDADGHSVFLSAPEYTDKSFLYSGARINGGVFQSPPILELSRQTFILNPQSPESRSWGTYSAAIKELFPADKLIVYLDQNDDVRCAVGGAEINSHPELIPQRIFHAAGYEGAKSFTVTDKFVGVKDVTLNGAKIGYTHNDPYAPIEKIVRTDENQLNFVWDDLPKEMKAAGYSYKYSYCAYKGGTTVASDIAVSPTVSNGVCNWKYTVPVDATANLYMVYLRLDLMKDGKRVNTVVYDDYIVRLRYTDAIAVGSVALTSPGLKEGATGGSDFTGSNTGVASAATKWQNIPNALAGGAKLNGLYTAEITLTAAYGYVFNQNTAVEVKGDYLNMRKYIGSNGKFMTVLVDVTARHEHRWNWEDNKDGTHSQVCTQSVCGAKRNTEPHDFATTETATKVTYTCSKCGYSRTESKAGENVISYIDARVTVPQEGQSVGTATSWVKLESRFTRDATIASAKWTKGDIGIAASAETFTGNFEAGQTYTITVTFTPMGGKIFCDPQTWRPLSCLGDKERSDAIVSEDGKTLTQSMSFIVKKSVVVDVALNDLGADGSVVPPTIEAGKAKESLLLVKKNDDFYSYSYSEGKWTTEQPKLAKGESASLALALIGDWNAEECIANLTNADDISSLATAYAEKNGVYAAYAVPDIDEKKVLVVDLTVDAPAYGATPATVAAVPAGANYTAGAVSWTPADSTFGTKAYTVSIPVTLKSGYSFAEGCIYTVNGYLASYKDGNVRCTFPALIATHTHSYGNWKKMNNNFHFRSCTGCDTSVELEAHTASDWITDTEATSTLDGTRHKECTVCHYVMETDIIPAIGELPFTDVSAADWFYKDVAYVYKNGLMNGTGATTFSPNITTTRGMIVTILYRLEGEPAVSGNLPFSDVKPGSYYENAIMWAAENNIVNGYGNGLFGPDDPITREQMAAIFWRYAKYAGYDVSIGENAGVLSYDDAGSVSPYAVPAMRWACGDGIINGMSATILSPQGNATRAQVGAILHRFCIKLGK